ncbi:hypothetical protein LCGC14_1998130 [marine sediment metagenome]|uniref:Uncharacterized protein n=1 Tax=marine sediment metagenome TaxID=412755 RepID=A0A0F9F481_9ZZZZ
MIILAIGIGYLIVSIAVFAWFLYRTGQHQTAQDLSDEQDLVWREQRRN